MTPISRESTLRETTANRPLNRAQRREAEKHAQKQAAQLQRMVHQQAVLRQLAQRRAHERLGAAVQEADHIELPADPDNPNAATMKLSSYGAALLNTAAAYDYQPMTFVYDTGDKFSIEGGENAWKEFACLAPIRAILNALSQLLANYMVQTGFNPPEPQPAPEAPKLLLLGQDRGSLETIKHVNGRSS